MTGRPDLPEAPSSHPPPRRHPIFRDLITRPLTTRHCIACDAEGAIDAAGQPWTIVRRRAGTRNCREAARVSAGHPVAPPGRRPRTAPQRRSAGRVAGRVRGRRPRLEQTEANSAVGPSLGCPRRFDASPDRGSSGRFGGPAWVRIRSVANSSRDWLADLRGDPTDKVPVVV